MHFCQFLSFCSGIISLCCLGGVYAMVDHRVLRNWDVFVYVCMNDLVILKQLGRTKVTNV
jgi:hypothetical protein